MWPGRKAVRARSLPPVERWRLASSSVSRSCSLSAIGASEVVSAPQAMPDVDLAEGDLVGDQDRRLQAGAAGLLDVVGGGLRGEPGAEHALAGEVAVAGVLEDGAAGDLAERLALQAEAVDEAVERGSEHVLVGGVRVDAVGAREGDAVAAEDGDPAGFGVHGWCFLFVGRWKRGAERGAQAGLDRRDQQLGGLVGAERLGPQPPAGERLGGAEQGGGEGLDFDPCGVALCLRQLGEHRVGDQLEDAAAVVGDALGDLAVAG